MMVSRSPGIVRIAARPALVLALAVAAAACSAPAPPGAAPGEAGPRETSADAASPPEAPLPSPGDGAPLVVFLGDSITAGYGLPGGEAFPALVGRELARRGRPVRVVNAGISGDTTSGGLSRLDWILRQEPDLVVVELGANDGLRGLPVDIVERNLRAIVKRCVASGAQVILGGMRVPPSYGPEYSESFLGAYTRVAGDLGVPLIPFILEGVAGIPSLNQPDGIHPTAEGHRILAKLILPYVEEALEGRDVDR